MLEELCANCFKKNKSSEICSHCGYSELDYIPNEYLKPGSILNGHYMVGQVLGCGGFGIEYLALDLNLNSKYRIKEYFPSNFCTREDGTENVLIISGKNKVLFKHGEKRFLKEARMISMYNDVFAAVDVSDFFQENNTAYMVMEYLEGEDLKTFLSKKSYGIVSYNEAKELLMPMLEAVKVMHDYGIIHRDISLYNIFITKTGQIKLLNFTATINVLKNKSAKMSVITNNGYAPPEEYISKGKRGPWTDIYAIGATIYKMITGILPDDAVERMVKDELKSPCQLGVMINNNADKAIMKALNLNIKDRYKSISDFIVDL